MIDIKRLLKKKSWTGEEVGRALIASLINDVKNKQEGKSKLLFTQEQFDRMESSLNDQFNLTSYEVFKNIFNATVDYYNKGQAFYQQFWNGFHRYLSALEEVVIADKILSDTDKHPLIMTQSQYDRRKGEAQERRRAVKTSFRIIIFDMLQHYIRQYEANLDIPNAIKAALEITKSEPVENKRILKNYNWDMRQGYYTLDDGRRSDRISYEEWREALKKDRQPSSLHGNANQRYQDRLLWCYRILFSEEDAITEEAASKAGITIPEGMINKDVIEHLEEMLDGLRLSKNLLLLPNVFDADTPESEIYYHEWHYYKTPPTGLIKYSIIAGGMIERYSSAHTALADGISETTQFKEFMVDYPALYEALKEDIASRIPRAKGLKPAQYNKELFTWGELADLDISVYKNLTNLTDADIWGKGVAIIKEPYSFDLDESGDYVEGKDPLPVMSIDILANNDTKRRELYSCVNYLLKPALRHIYAYNVLVDIIVKAYAIEGLEHLKMDLNQSDEELDGLNKYLFLYYKNIYGSGVEKKRKRALIREIFKPIYPDELKPDPEAITEMQKRINSLGLTAEARKQFIRFDPLIAELVKKGE